MTEILRRCLKIALNLFSAGELATHFLMQKHSWIGIFLQLLFPYAIDNKLIATPQTNKWLRQQMKSNKSIFDFHKIHKDDGVQKKITHDWACLLTIFEKVRMCKYAEKPRNINCSFNHFTWLTFNLKHKSNHFTELTSSKSRKENWTEKSTHKTSEEYRRRTGHVLHTECKIARLVQNQPDLVRFFFAIFNRKKKKNSGHKTRHHHIHLYSFPFIHSLLSFIFIHLVLSVTS